MGSSHVENGVRIYRGLGNRKQSGISSPTTYLLLYEPPAIGGSFPDGVSVFWHRARMPGTWPAHEDDKRGPRFAVMLFVDGHTTLVDCSGYQGMPDDRLGIVPE